MQVGLVTGKRQIELVDMPEPEPSAGRAVVDISYCGICGTDVHAFLSGAPYNPAICGHEWVGMINKLGEQVAGFKEGDRVAIGAGTACGRCATCQRGDTTHCEAVFASVVGMGPTAASHGGFARAISFDAGRLYHVPGPLSDTQAGLLEPATVAVHALRRTPLNLGDTVVVIGAGPIGLLVLQAAKLSGAGSIILIEPELNRRRLGAELGADLTIDPTTQDTAADLNSHLGASGADVVFECAGVPATIQSAVDLARRGGIVSLVGVANGAASIDAAGWLAKEISVVSSIAYLHEDFEICKHLVADGRIQTDPLHTSTVSLEELDSAFTRLAEHPAEVKILVDPRL
jgi:(R,R)-butanediol dehydrogenase/meso-butanediol dehydrogenase/diacetyl reductase